MKAIEFDFQKEARDALESKADFVTITGASGLGKSRLVADYANREDTTVIDQAHDLTWEQFEAITQHEYRVICTLPKRLNMLDIPDRMKTRISQGRIVNLETPDYAERADVIDKMGCGEWADEIIENVLEFPALVGCCKSLAEVAPKDSKAARKVVENYETNKSVRRGSLLAQDVYQAAVNEIWESYRISEAELLCRRKPKHIATPRTLLMYALRKLTTMSLTEVGDKVGGRDHSTVLHACQKCDNITNPFHPTAQDFLERMSGILKYK